MEVKLRALTCVLGRTDEMFTSSDMGKLLESQGMGYISYKEGML